MNKVPAALLALAASPFLAAQISPAGLSMPMTAFTAYASPEAKPFQGAYFGMPVVVGPYEPGGRLRMVRGRDQLVFEEEGQGFVLAEILPLPEPPAAEFPEGEDPAILVRKADGYQLGPQGEVFWTGGKGLYRFDKGAWRLRWSFPKAAEGEGRPPRRGGLVVLPGDRLAYLGGREAFLQVLQLGEGGEAKVLGSVGYDRLGCRFETFSCNPQPAFCVVRDQLYFYLHGTGRLFRLGLEGRTLTDYSVPWPAQVFGSAPGPLKWDDAKGSDLSAPVIPNSLTFAPDRSGSVWVGALMFNAPLARFETFELGPEGSSLDVTRKLGPDLPGGPQYRDTAGLLADIPAYPRQGKSGKERPLK